MLRAKLVEEFKEQVPDSMTFKVGYFDEGQRNNKMWVVTTDDIEGMYAACKAAEITLWCEGRSGECEEPTRKRRRDQSQYQEKQEEVKLITEELKEKHEEMELPKMRLWAKMIAMNNHDSMDEPPDIPSFNGSSGKKTCRSREPSFSGALTGAAIAFAKAVSSNTKPESVSEEHTAPVGTISPGKTVELRAKNYEQLRNLQGLYNDGILSTIEYSEQKENILKVLKNL